MFSSCVVRTCSQDLLKRLLRRREDPPRIGFAPYRGTSLVRNSAPLRPYSSNMPRALVGGAVSCERGTSVGSSKGGAPFIDAVGTHRLCSPQSTPAKIWGCHTRAPHLTTTQDLLLRTSDSMTRTHGLSLSISLFISLALSLARTHYHSRSLLHAQRVAERSPPSPPNPPSLVGFDSIAT